MNGAEAIIRCLELEGIDKIFSYPGGSVLSLFEAIRTSAIENILTRTEQGAAHAASGYARISGKPGVCLATSGPGATNLVTGLATAFMDSIPLVAITGQVPISMIGTDAFQEIDITGITKPIVKHSYLVTDTNDLPNIIREAFHLAGTGRPGPVLIDVPKNISDAECTAKIPGEIHLPGYKPTYKGHKSQIKMACRMLAEAKKPLIYAGGGVVHSGAEDLLLELARRMNAPVAVTLMGKGAFPFKDDLYVGMLGLHGCPAANMAVSNCDVLLSIGARFDDRVTGNLDMFAANAKVIHIDIDPAEIGKNVVPNVPIVGDASCVIKEMLEILEKQDHNDWLEEIDSWRPMQLAVYQDNENQQDLSFRQVIDSFSKLTKGNAIVTVDVGQHQMVAAQFYKARRAKGFLTSGGLGTMGYGLPAAVGAQLADCEALVACITGDGSLQMSMNELATARAHNLPIKVILSNNQNLGMVRQLQKYYVDEKYFGIDLTGNPEFAKIAEAYDMAYYRIEKPTDIEPVLTEAIQNDRLTLIECTISPQEMVYPMVLNGKGLDDMIVASAPRKNQE